MAMVVGMLSIGAAVLCAGVVAFIFEGDGGRVHSGERLFEVVLVLLVFGAVLNYGLKLANSIDRKSKK